MVDCKRPCEPGYTWLARVGSGVFLVVQMVILLDFAFFWNESWVAKEHVAWVVGLLVSTVVLYAGSIALVRRSSGRAGILHDYTGDNTGCGYARGCHTGAGCTAGALGQSTFTQPAAILSMRRALSFHRVAIPVVCFSFSVLIRC